LSKFQRKIAILEQRLQNVHEYESVFPRAQHRVYELMLAYSYEDLCKFVADCEDATLAAIDVSYYHDKSFSLLASAVVEAARDLPVTNVTRLLLIYEYARVLITRSEQLKAKTIAQEILDEAILLPHDLAEDAMKVLQKIRDDFISPFRVKDTAERDEIIQQAIDITSDDLASRSIASPRSHKGGNELDAVNSVKVKDSVAMFHNIRFLLNKYQQVTTILDKIPSSASIIRALDRIFRAYIRGNALPGQLSSGQTVDMAGHTISFRNFILNGPYLSWRGYVQILIDFGIAGFPKVESKRGKKLWQTLNLHHLQAQTAMQTQEHSHSADPLVDIKEAALIFIQSSGSRLPVLTLRKFLGKYIEEQNLDHDSRIESENWKNVQSWSENDTANEWDINVGTNFMHFIDCIGKLGVIGYSKDRFQELLPTAQEKIEHFLSAYLGLADERKWTKKVQQKIKAVKAEINDATHDNTGGATSPSRKQGSPLHRK
jgi:hypothetical protein